MKRKLALSFLFVFTLALTTPVISEAMNQDPQKTEKTEKKECEKKKACSEKKKECEKKAEKEKK